MIPEKEPSEVVAFCKERGIMHIHIDTDEYDIDCIPSKEEKKRVISLLIDESRYPLYFYGSKNSQIANVYIMLLRYAQRYNSSYIFREFKKYGEKLDDDLKGIFDDLRISVPAHLPEWLPEKSINPQVLLPE
ncbi:tyrosine phospatase-like protein [Blastocystis sp. ATCC 50177/Nand II]|uniref:Tyrosine phospatase-like protein n=1 Tax=Blastocystis sp. subtype 1 (strain ATCC 50177 / NandII) TaxID=478820 RepID=A0A196SDG9_BLAHN|nr:tyrosine phospatase-like protein [Blastocystis sp. ATCC 50177/Nand II]